jgi:nitrate reductase alpha subunit
MGTGKRRINSAVRVLLIVLVAELEHAQVAVELEHAQVVAELEHAQVVELVLAQVAAERVLAQVAAELEHAQVVELVLAQVAAERELARVEVVPELDPLRAQLAGVLKTKSVTGVPRHDLVLIAAEDLAAAAETTRVPAATEAAVAWAVADIVVVVAEDAAAEE